MHSDREHADNTTCQTVIQAEGRSTAALHVKRDGLKSAHMEERLVLDLGQACMVQVVAEHETSGLVLHALHALEGRLSWWFFWA